jgi:uncharacterized membrane protein YkvA (DUF1232 family)
MLILLINSTTGAAMSCLVRQIGIMNQSQQSSLATENPSTTLAAPGALSGRNVTNVHNPDQQSITQRVKLWAKSIKRELSALAIAIQKPECPLSAKIVAGATIAYALSPIDLIPDFIPVLGLVDEAILLPIGIKAAIRLIPKELMDQCRAEAENTSKLKKNNWKMAAAVIAVQTAVGYKLCKKTWGWIRGGI